ncbi:MAG TPA: hypothetical protein VFJ82_09850 [Longimicrobium sp.]|nr:hypothetical protein [Longimicrobium sp.]
MSALAHERRAADAPAPRRPSARSGAPLPAAPALMRAMGNQGMLRVGGAHAKPGENRAASPVPAVDGPVLRREKKKAAGPCAGGKKTVTIDLVKLDGSSHDPAADLAEMNKIYAPCCVEFTLGASHTATAAQTTAWIGDQDVNVAPACGSVSAEEKSLYDNAAKDLKLGSRMRAFFAKSISGYNAYAYSLPPYCATGTAAGYVNHLIVENRGYADTLAHEMGHILINSGDHHGIVDPADKTNLMYAPGRTASTLDASQCAAIFGNA